MVAADEASFQWNIGDGATDIAAGHAYAAPGTYFITLTATHRNRQTDTAQAKVPICAPELLNLRADGSPPVWVTSLSG